jgi:hypothetical protein
VFREVSPPPAGGNDLMQSYKGLGQKVAGVEVMLKRKTTVFGNILNKSQSGSAVKLGKSGTFHDGEQLKKTGNSSSPDTARLKMGKSNISSYGQGSNYFRSDTPSTYEFKMAKSKTYREHENEFCRQAWHQKRSISRDELLERIKKTHYERKNEASYGFKHKMESHLEDMTESFVGLQHEYENAQKIKLHVHKHTKKITQQSFVMQDNGQNCSRRKLKKSDKFFRSFFMPESPRQPRKSTYTITPKRILIAANKMAKGYVGVELENCNSNQTKV